MTAHGAELVARFDPRSRETAQRLLGEVIGLTKQCRRRQKTGAYSNHRAIDLRLSGRWRSSQQ